MPTFISAGVDRGASERDGPPELQHGAPDAQFTTTQVKQQRQIRE